VKAVENLRAALADRYAIEREIGAGGMATVYLARDIKHHRKVALKLLDPELGAVIGAERFLAEIEVTANLHHPNLLPLFDSGEADGLLYYVMPYVEGESLRAKLTREKQLPVEEAVQIAAAIASALDYAHRHGVIHRDLKPENILLHEEQPLVADFGIALAISKASDQRITQTGISLGTPQYMSPEQATGDRTVDGRSDIYSLGVITYEMLTGEPPHTGKTTQATIAKVVMDRPRSMRLSRDTVPPHVEAAVNRALAKLPADRFHTAREFGAALQGKGAATPYQTSAPEGVPRFAATPATRRRKLMIVGACVVAGALAVIAGIASWRKTTERGGNASVASFFVDLPMSHGFRERVGSVAISPDGRTVAFVAQSDSSSHVYVRRVEDLEPRLLPGTNGAIDVAFSPDGSWLTFSTTGAALRKAQVDGSSMVTIANGLKYFGSLTWANPQTIVVGGASTAHNGLVLLATSSGAVRSLTKPAARLGSHGMPLVGPDGETLLFEDWGWAFTEDDFLAIGSLTSGEFATTPLLAVQPIGIVDGRILYVSASGAIMAVPFDVGKRRITGDPVRVMEGVGADNRGLLGDSPHSVAALSSNGTLVYTRGRPTQHLVSVDLAGNQTAALTSEDRDHLSPWSGGPRFSPDGRRVAVTVITLRGDTTTSEIWTLDAVTRTFTPLTSLGNVVAPEWTPDGRRVVFTTWYEKKPTIWSQLADGSQPAEKILELPDGQVVRNPNVTPDGQGVIFCKVSDLLGNSDLFYLPLAGQRKPQRIAGPFGFVCDGRVSPDGRWLAYVANEDEKPKVYVRPFRGAGSPVQISPAGGDTPRWSRDGSRVYYRHAESALGRGSLFVARIKATAGGLTVEQPQRIAALGEGGVYDISPDGTHAVMLAEGDSRVQLVVTANWIAQLRARIEATK
jgi:Tol biopolymer transport system component/tRNA A-37 threonylcarbamoyl transferase component Bud32